MCGGKWGEWRSTRLSQGKAEGEGSEENRTGHGREGAVRPEATVSPAPVPAPDRDCGENNSGDRDERAEEDDQGEDPDSGDLQSAHACGRDPAWDTRGRQRRVPHIALLGARPAHKRRGITSAHRGRLLRCSRLPPTPVPEAPFRRAPQTPAAGAPPAVAGRRAGERRCLSPELDASPASACAPRCRRTRGGSS